MRSTRFVALVLCAFAAASCGASDGASEAGGNAGDVASADQGDAAVDSGVDLNTDYFENDRQSAEDFDEQTTSTGATVLVSIDCDNAMGRLLLVASLGLTPGEIYEGTVEPASGGDLTMQILPDGVGRGGRQSRWDSPRYIVTFGEIDGGMTFEVQGCGPTG